MNNWIVFRMPNMNEFMFLKNENSGSEIIDFNSFLLDKTIKFQSEKTFTINENQIKDLQIETSQNTEEIKFPSKTEYILKIEKAKDFIIKENLKKIVISRPKLVEYNQINLAETYLKLSKNYPNAFCYLMQFNGEIWIGATPELLGSYDNSTLIFECMSLAGTLTKGSKWTTKEIKEQKAVTENILTTLNKFSSNIKISETKEHQYGSIKHLRTDFFAEITEKNIEILISELHPTPAVCGFPKDKCKKFIKETENYNRSFYTGYIKINTQKINAYYVNLRCAQIFTNQAILYIGGGINTESIAENEFLETEIKSQAIANNLIINITE